MAQVAGGEAAGLARQPVGPLQTRTLHPARGAGSVAGDEVDRGSAAQKPAERQVGPEPVDQVLLLGKAEADEDQVRLRLHHVGADRRQPVRVGVEPVLGRGAPGHPQSRAGGGEHGSGAAAAWRLTWLPSQQVDRAAGPGQVIGERPDQAGARHPLRQRRAGQPGRPHQRHAVGHHQARVGEESAYRGIGAGQPQNVHVGRDDPAAFPPLQGRTDRPHHLCLGDRVDLNSG